MSTTADVRSRIDLISDLSVNLTPAGRIIDYLRPDITRPDTPEERVRQFYGRTLVEEYGYAPAHMAFEAPISIGSETKFADIVVYNSPTAAVARDQGQIWLIVEVKQPAFKLVALMVLMRRSLLASSATFRTVRRGYFLAALTGIQRRISSNSRHASRLI